jgi:hypothetical protein
MRTRSREWHRLNLKNAVGVEFLISWGKNENASNSESISQ